MTAQQRFRGQGFDGAIGPVALRRSVAISLSPAGWGRTLVAVGGAALLVALALWASAGTAVAVVAVGVGVTAWGWQRAQQRKGPDLAHRKGPDLGRDELARFCSPLPASAAASGSLRSPRTLPALLTAETGLTRPEARAELLAWCTDPAARPVRVLAGVGGAGKTCLAVEVARALPPGWTGGVARPGRAAQVLPAAVRAERPVLIVVDDADTEPTADIAALSRQAEGEQRIQVRVLLVVRDADAFSTALDEHLSTATWQTTTLPVIAVDNDRRRVFADAVRAFDGLADDAPLPPWAEVERGPVGADGEPMAVIKTRAALAVLAEDPDRAVAMRTADLDRLTDEILTHERKRWHTDAVDPDAQEEAVLTLLLRGPRSIEDAVGALRALHRFGDRDDVHDIAVRVRSLYPAATDEPWPAPRPDLLHAAMLTAAIERHRSQVDAALDDDPPVFLRIARAAACSPRLAALAHPLLTDARLVAVTEAAVLTDRLSLRDDLVETLTGRALDSADVERLLPITEATAWSPVRAALRRAEAQHLRAQTTEDGPRLACALAQLGGILRDTGAHAEALTPTREAIELYRDLGDHPADLARALTGLGASLRSLDNHDDGVAADREAVQLMRDLDLALAPDLARSLTGLAVTLTAAGAHAEALAAGREAVQGCRDLATARPTRHYPDLAAALAAVSASLLELRALDEAATAAREAVRLHWDVATNSAERHSPDLARSLTDLAAVLREAGAHDDALTASREAVQRYQDLAAAHRNRHLPDFARALGVLGACLRDMGSYTASLAAGRNAVRLNRQLAAGDPARHTPDLARSLTHLGIGLRGHRPYEQSLAPGVEAVQLNRELAAADPARHTAELARSLTELGISLRALGMHHDALAATDEAVHLGRHLAAAEPARHTGDIARSLISLGAGLRALGRRPEAVLHEGEAVAWWWQLTQLCPGEYDDRYRDAQLRFLRTFSLYDHDSGDLRTAELIARSQVQSYLEGAGDRQADAKSEALVEHRGRTSSSPARCHAV